jgi:hypothetical protein
MDIAGEIRIHRGSRVFWHQCQHFRDSAAGRNCRAQHRNRLPVVLYDHVDTLPDDLFQHRREILRDFGFAHVQFSHILQSYVFAVFLRRRRRRKKAAEAIEHEIAQEVSRLLQASSWEAARAEKSNLDPIETLMRDGVHHVGAVALERLLPILSAQPEQAGRMLSAPSFLRLAGPLQPRLNVGDGPPADWRSSDVVKWER